MDDDYRKEVEGLVMLDGINDVQPIKDDLLITFMVDRILLC